VAQRSALRAYLREVREIAVIAFVIAVCVSVLGALCYFGISTWFWISGEDPEWADAWTFTWGLTAFCAAAALVGVAVAAVAYLPFMMKLRDWSRGRRPWLRRRLRWGAGKTEVRDVAVLAALGASGRAELHRNLCPVRLRSKQRRTGVGRVAQIVVVFVWAMVRTFFSGVIFTVVVLLVWSKVLQAIVPGWKPTAQEWIVIVGLAASAVAGVVTGIQRVKTVDTPPPPPPDPLVLVGQIEAKLMDNPGHTPDAADIAVWLHANGRHRHRLRVNVQHAARLHLDGTTSSLPERRGPQVLKATAQGSRRVLPQEQVALACRVDPDGELIMIGRVRDLVRGRPELSEPG
jgi:hypothetical protein